MAEKDFRVKKGLQVDGTGDSSIAGNLGIGTTSPTHKLHLHDASRVDIKFSNDNDESHYIRKDGHYLRIRGEDDSTILMEIRNNSSSNFVSFPNGNVGIGTSSPAKLLHLESTMPEIYMVDSDATSDPHVRLFNNAGNYNVRVDDGDTGTGGNVLWYTSSTEKMRLSDAGRLGIGTTSPRSPLHIKGPSSGWDKAFTIEDHDTANYGQIIYDSGGMKFRTFEASDSFFWRNDSNTTNMILTDAGRLGLGNASPSSKLHVEQTDNTTFATTNQIDDYQIFVKNNTVTIDAIAGIAFDISTETDTDTIGASIAAIRDTSASSTAANHDTNLVFATNDAGDDGNTERMRITHDGNVGIGTTAPGGLLDIMGTSGNQLRLSYNANYYWIMERDSNGKFNITNHQNDTDVKAITIDTTEQVGIGTTSPAFPLDVSGWISTTDGIVHTGDTNNTIQFDTDIQKFNTAGTTRMAIIANGNVGIGTTSPDAKLHVEGSVLIDAYQVGAGAGLFFREDFLNTAQPSITLADHSGANPDGLSINSYDGTSFRIADTEKMRLTSTGLGIGTTSPASALHVVGHIQATTKSFVIDHPSKEGMTLRHGSLEGPEHAVYIRGQAKGNLIDLPDYWSDLVDEESITVQLTPKYHHQTLYVKSVDNEKVVVGSPKGITPEFYYLIHAERKDVDKMVVEY